MCTGAELFVAGGALKGYGAYQQGQAAANLAQHNEAVARFRAKDVIDIARLDIAEMRRRAAQLIGSQRVAFAGHGLLVDVGTPAEVAADTAYTANIDEQRIMANAIRERWGLLQQADDFSEQAKAASKAGTAGAIGSVLGGGADAFGSVPV